MEHTSEVSPIILSQPRSSIVDIHPSVQSTLQSAPLEQRIPEREFPAGNAFLMQRDIFFRKHTYVDDIVKDLIVMRTLLPSHRPSGIVLTTLNGNHSSPQDTLGALLDLLKKDPTPTFNYVVHTGPISGASTKERYRSLMQMYPHHLTPSPRFVIVPDYGGMLGVSDSPYISWNGVQEDDAELVPVQDDHKRTSFMVYNSYQMERRPIVLKPDWFRPIIAPAASVPQRYFDFADKL